MPKDEIKQGLCSTILDNFETAGIDSTDPMYYQGLDDVYALIDPMITLLADQNIEDDESMRKLDAIADLATELYLVSKLALTA